VDAFVRDPDPAAFDRVVDRLLASPRYGEHMARDWLDAARYADTHGYFTDHERFMWRWRDWVINAFNGNMPFDQFTVEQIAGDLLPSATVDQRIATGFNRNHMVTEETGVIPEEYRVEYVADRVRTTTAVWMGLTAGCAQCHDHKYDPLTQREFYRLFAYFNSVPEEGISGGKKNAAPILDLATPDDAVALASTRERIRALEQKLNALPAATANEGPGAAAVEASRPQRAAPDPIDSTSNTQSMLTDTAEAERKRRQERKALETERDQLREQERQIVARTTVMIMQDMEKPRDTFILVRGQYDQPGERVEPGVPAFLPPLPCDAPPNRLGFARWLFEPSHPLTARVAVNRVWRQVFGAGLVATPEDFGLQGEPPSHPELLDWLANYLVECNWDIKRLQRLMVLSATYRQSSHWTRELLAADPNNRLLARSSRFRLDAETIRDAALFSSALMCDELGGPSVRPYQPADLWKHITYDRKNTQSYDQSTGADLYRRGLYTYWKRQVPPPTMQVLDAPTRETCVLRRQRTNTPLQALALLNDEQLVEAARALGQRMLQCSEDDRERIAFGFRLVTARHPTQNESNELLRLVNAERRDYQSDESRATSLIGVGESAPASGVAAGELAAWTVVANLLLNLDEALNRE
jgi:hypothetical protein